MDNFTENIIILRVIVQLEWLHGIRINDDAKTKRRIQR